MAHSRPEMAWNDETMKRYCVHVVRIMNWFDQTIVASNENPKWTLHTHKYPDRITKDARRL